MTTNIFDMEDIRYINLFSKVTKVNTRYFFRYNNFLVFCVPKNLVSKAVGENGKNVKKINKITKRSIKILGIPKNEQETIEFIRELINPVAFKNIEINDKEVIINAGKLSKSLLIGREKKKLFELQQIIKNLFKKDLKIN